MTLWAAREGKNVKVQAFVFIPEGVTVEDGVFLGPHVCFTNDLYPRAVNADGQSLGPEEWTEVPTLVKARASIGANATILAGVAVGTGAMVGAVGRAGWRRRRDGGGRRRAWDSVSGALPLPRLLRPLRSLPLLSVIF